VRLPCQDEVVECVERAHEPGAPQIFCDTPVEQKLVHRIGSLFWRLRRASGIETGLLRMQAEILCAFRSSRPKPTPGGGETPSPSAPFDPRESTGVDDGLDDIARGGPGDLIPTEPLGASASRAVAVSLLRSPTWTSAIVHLGSVREARCGRPHSVITRLGFAQRSRPVAISGSVTTADIPPG
jgi:hypothetical protein